MSNLLETARALAAAGISVIPVAADGTKRPAIAWKPYMAAPAGPDEITRWFPDDGTPRGLGIVTGAVSGNLELTEIEGRAAPAIPTIAQLAADTGLGDLWARLCTGWLEKSPSGGWHWFYRVQWPEGAAAPGNTKLASRPSTPGELAENPQAKTQVLAETRAEGGYVVVAPSNGTCHPTGKAWTRITGGPATAPVLTPEEREAFHALLGTLHEPAAGPDPAPPTYPAGEASSGSPGDDYERRTDWADLLLPAGWTLVATAGEERRWRRPGKGLGQSATTGHAGDRDRLYVFTTSTEFEMQRPYTKFGAYAVLHHGGDHRAAAAELRRQGYGDPAGPPAAARAKPFNAAAGTVDGALATVHRLPDPAPDPNARTIDLTPAADIKPRRVRWLWDGRLALGTLGLLAGRQGLGKSTLAYWVAAQITQGTLPGEYKGTPRAVLVCATEDSWEHTIVPRLIAHGADLTKVFRTTVTTESAIHVPLSLPRDNRAVEKAAVEQGAALLILDPIISRLGELDTHRDAEVRMALEPLVDVAGRARMAVLGLIHHNKSGGADPLQSVMGSTAFSAVARSVHSVVPDPDDDTGQKRLFGTPKNNLGRTDLPTLEFTVESFPVPTEDDGPAWTGRINWLGEHEGSIEDAMRQSNEDLGGDRGAVQEAADWLQDYLTSEGGSAPSADIKREGAKAGHSYDALKRARKKIHLVYRNDGFPRRSFWFFPGPALTQSEQSEQSEQESTDCTVQSEQEQPTAPTGPGAVGASRGGRHPTALTTTTVLPLSVSAVGAVGAGAGVRARELPLRCPLHPTPHPGCYTCDALAEAGPQ